MRDSALSSQGRGAAEDVFPRGAWEQGTGLFACRARILTRRKDFVELLKSAI